MISPSVPPRKVWTLLAQLVFSAAAASAGTLDLPAVEISATSLTFGNQVVESPSQPQRILLLNRGSVPLAIKKITASGDFAVKSDCGDTLEAGHGCTIVTTFSPSLVGDTDGKLTIEDDSNSSPHVVNLSGSGVLPLTITPATLRFGPRTVGTSETALVTITNNQADRIVALQIVSSGNFSQSNACAMGIPAGKSCDVRVTFTPREAKPVRGKIIFAYAGKTQVLTVAGTGVATSPIVSGLRVATPRIPAVAALAPVIPPAPTLNGIGTSRPTPAAAPVAVIPPAPVVGNVRMTSARTSGSEAQVIPPAPALNTALPITTRADRAGAPEVISPPPKITSDLGRSPRVTQTTTPAVIGPAPSTNALHQNARVAPGNPDVALRPTPPVEAAKPAETQIASMKAPAETSAVRAMADRSAPPAPASTTQVVKPSTGPGPQVPAPPVLVASAPTPSRSAATGPKVRLMVGLKGTAAGSVTSSSGSINCGATCQDNFVAGQKVVLTPQVPTNASFGGWRGCDSVAGTNCTVVMDRDKSVTAIFVRHYDDLSPE